MRSVEVECEQVLAGVEDRLDPLPDRGEVWPALGLVASRRPEHGRAELGDCGCELATGVAFVADDRLAAVERPREQLERCFTLGAVGADQGCGSGGAVGGAGEVEPHSQNQREWLRE